MKQGKNPGSFPLHKDVQLHLHVLFGKNIWKRVHGLLWKPSWGGREFLFPIPGPSKLWPLGETSQGTRSVRIYMRGPEVQQQVLPHQAGASQAASWLCLTSCGSHPSQGLPPPSDSVTYPLLLTHFPLSLQLTRNSFYLQPNPYKAIQIQASLPEKPICFLKYHPWCTIEAQVQIRRNYYCNALNWTISSWNKWQAGGSSGRKQAHTIKVQRDALNPTLKRGWKSATQVRIQQCGQEAPRWKVEFHLFSK